MESPSSPQLWVPLSEPPRPRRVGSHVSAQYPALGHTQLRRTIRPARPAPGQSSALRAQAGWSQPALAHPQQRLWRPLLPDSMNVAESDSLWGPALGKLSSLASGGTS